MKLHPIKHLPFNEPSGEWCPHEDADTETRSGDSRGESALLVKVLLDDDDSHQVKVEETNTCGQIENEVRIKLCQVVLFHENKSSWVSRYTINTNVFTIFSAIERV